MDTPDNRTHEEKIREHLKFAKSSGGRKTITVTIAGMEAMLKELDEARDRADRLLQAEYDKLT